MPSLVYLWINIAQTLRNPRACVCVGYVSRGSCIQQGRVMRDHDHAAAAVETSRRRRLVSLTPRRLLKLLSLPQCFATHFSPSTWRTVRHLPTLCACASWLRCFDTATTYLPASFPNANCLRILNEPLKYWTQWLRPPEARAAGTRARNAVVNESPTGRGRRVGEVQPR